MQRLRRSSRSRCPCSSPAALAPTSRCSRERRRAGARTRPLRGCSRFTAPAQAVRIPGGPPARQRLRLRQRERRRQPGELPPDRGRDACRAGRRHAANWARTRKATATPCSRSSGRESLVYVIECDKQDKAMLEAARVEIRGKYECFIDNVANPAAFFAGLKRNDSRRRWCGSRRGTPDRVRAS